MLTDRDKILLKFIEDFGSITTRQASELFFDGIYESARRRLSYYENSGRLKYYISKYNKEKVYYDSEKNKLTVHYLFVIDYLVFLHKHGANLKTIKFHPYYLNNKVVPDAFVSFEYEGFLYLTFVEVDYTHHTENSKFKKYEELYKEKELYPEFHGEFPAIVVIRTTPGIRYSSQYFDIYYTDLKLNKLDTFLLN